MDLTQLKDGNEKVGRPQGSGFIDKPKHVGLKMPAELEKRFIEKARELAAKGYKGVDGRRVGKSDIIRTLAEYWLEHAEEVYREVRPLEGVIYMASWFNGFGNARRNALDLVS